MPSGQTGSGALVRHTNSIPHGSQPAYVSMVGSAGAAAVVLIPASVMDYTFISGFTVTAQPPTSGTTAVGGVVTISDGVWTLSYQFVDGVNDGGKLEKEFAIPMKSTFWNSAVTLTLPAISNGGATAMELRGYYNPAAG